MLTHTIARLSQSVLHVTAERTGGIVACGTGFVVQTSGLAATAYHLVRAAERVWMRGVGWERPAPASVVAFDAEADIAVCRLLASDLAAVALREDLRSAPLGSEVLFMGFPYSDVFDPPLLHTSRGLLANRYRLLGVDHYVVDAICAEGLSGGPLALAPTAEVLGVVGSRFDPRRARAKLRGASPDELANLPAEPSGLTFAAHSDRLRTLLQQLSP